MIVVDTDVFSELMRSTPSREVDGWLAAQDESEIFVTAVTVAEVSYGIERLPAGRRKQALRATADAQLAALAEQVLPLDEVAGRHYGEIANERQRTGRPISAMDALIAAICRSRGAVLATGNTKDFDGTGVSLVNPWVAS